MAFSTKLSHSSLALALALSATTSHAQQADWNSSINAGRKAHEQGDDAAAEKYFASALTAAEKSGTEDAKLTMSLNLLAAVSDAQGRYAEAQQLYQRALTIDEKALGPDHLSIATDLSNVAMMHCAQGRYAEAEKLYKRALTIREKALGPDQPAVAQTLVHMAVLYARQKKIDQATSFMDRASSIREKTLGANFAGDPSISPNNLDEKEPQLAWIEGDEGAKDQSFNQFRKTLQAAVSTRNKKLLLAAVSPNVQTGLGAGRGQSELLGQWQNLSPKSRFWICMERALEHGVTYENGLATDRKVFHAPAVEFFDDQDFRAVVWNKGARVYQAANESAKILRTIDNHDAVSCVSDDFGPLKTAWTKIKTRDGLTGFMKTADLYCEYDEFAEFAKDHGKWLLIWFGTAHT